MKFHRTNSNVINGKMFVTSGMDRQAPISSPDNNEYVEMS